MVRRLADGWTVACLSIPGIQLKATISLFAGGSYARA
jgi:hypothetical protein